MALTPSNLLAEGVEEMNPKKIIFETDMCTDVDDVGALAVLHALADNGEAEILAISFNEVHPSGAGTICAINTWYNRGDIPIGIYKDVISPVLMNQVIWMASRQIFRMISRLCQRPVPWIFIYSCLVNNPITR